MAYIQRAKENKQICSKFVYRHVAYCHRPVCLGIQNPCSGSLGLNSGLSLIRGLKACIWPNHTKLNSIKKTAPKSERQVLVKQEDLYAPSSVSAEGQHGQSCLHKRRPRDRILVLFLWSRRRVHVDSSDFHRAPDSQRRHTRKTAGWWEGRMKPTSKDTGETGH